MNKSLQRNLAIILILMAAWVIIILTAVNFMFNGLGGYIALCFGVLSFLVAGTSLYAWELEKSRNRAMTEVNALPLILTAAYLVLSVAANSYFCVRAMLVWSARLPMIGNVIILAGFLITRIFMDPYRNMAEENVETAADKISLSVEAGKHLTEMLSDCTDPSVRTELLKLKQLLNYSSNVPKAGREDYENLFLSILSDADFSMKQGDDAERTISLLKDAESAWKKAFSD